MVQQRFDSARRILARKPSSSMPEFLVSTPTNRYPAIVERGCLRSLAAHLPKGAGKVFVVTEWDVWQLHQGPVLDALAGHPHQVLFLPGGEPNKRLAPLEALADQMLAGGADRSSVVVAFGGGIVNDMGGFLAAMYMRGIPVIQAPTTLLAQVDASVGGKTGVNLAGGKNLIGAFHQPLAVLIDPAVIDTLPEREYRAGLYEIIKCGIIGDAPLFDLLESSRNDVLARQSEVVDRIIGDSVRLKAEIVSADEREGGLRRVLNLGHTFGHALEAETGYERFLHGEAVAWGMRAATRLALDADLLAAAEAKRIDACIESYGPIPSLAGIDAEAIAARLTLDKKTRQGRVHFVLPEAVGRVRVTADIAPALALEAIRFALGGAVLAQ